MRIRELLQNEHGDDGLDKNAHQRQEGEWDNSRERLDMNEEEKASLRESSDASRLVTTTCCRHTVLTLETLIQY